MCERNGNIAAVLLGWQHCVCCLMPICAKFANTHCISLLLELLIFCCCCYYYLVMYFKNKVKCETYLLYLLAALIKISLVHVFDQITNLR